MKKVIKIIFIVLLSLVVVLGITLALLKYQSHKEFIEECTATQPSDVLGKCWGTIEDCERCWDTIQSGKPL